MAAFNGAFLYASVLCLNLTRALMMRVAAVSIAASVVAFEVRSLFNVVKAWLSAISRSRPAFRDAAPWLGTVAHQSETTKPDQTPPCSVCHCFRMMLVRRSEFSVHLVPFTFTYAAMMQAGSDFSSMISKLRV